MSNDANVGNTLFATTIAHETTGSFSKLIIDYISQQPRLKDFFSYTPDTKGIEDVIRDIHKFSFDRKILTDTLRQQYRNVLLPPILEECFGWLEKENCFTVCTAHQPVIFLGPLYFIYKILHTIKLAETLSLQYPEYHIIPVFYMGSEDADLDEIGTVNLDGLSLQWKTNQKGAVGRMRVDDAFLELIAMFEGRYLQEPFGLEIMSLFRKSYLKGRTIQEATFLLIHELFGERGLIVFIPDHPQPKSLFLPIAEKELSDCFSEKALSKTMEKLSKDYKIQAFGRNINLFLLENQQRVRIEKKGDLYSVEGKRAFPQKELIELIKRNPETISPNVILRGVFQQLVLPNLVYVGGGGELSYWLELKEVFEAAGVLFPMLLLRNSFIILSQRTIENIQSVDMPLESYFLDIHVLQKKWLLEKSGSHTSIEEEKKTIGEVMNGISLKIEPLSHTLSFHVGRIKNIFEKQMDILEKKIIKEEKNKEKVALNRIDNTKLKFFPNGILQERTLNFANYYAKYGKEWINHIYENSSEFAGHFKIIQEFK